MNTRKCTLFVILFLLAAAQAIQAQQAPVPSPFPPRSASTSSIDESPSRPAVFYRLDFVIREMDKEKLVDTRNYSLWVQSGVSESMNAGSEVPYSSGSYSTTGSGTTKSISYRSVGVSIACTVKEGEGNPQLDLMLNISDALPPEKDSDTPAFRKVSVNSKAMLSLGKSTTVSIVEDPGSRHRFQVDVTAIKLK
jgi:hypothetical protein